jgi:hypothetical protein
MLLQGPAFERGFTPAPPPDVSPCTLTEALDAEARGLGAIRFLHGQPYFVRGAAPVFVGGDRRPAPSKAFSRGGGR